MFTGIIEQKGQVKKIVKKGGIIDLTVSPKKKMPPLKKGGSIAIDGICLTVVKKGRKTFSVQASKETCLRSTLGEYQVGTQVNLETPLLPTEPIGGHFVSGHVDGVGEIVKKQAENGTVSLHIRVPSSLRRYLAVKGSIAIDGVSLTLASSYPDGFGTVIIPHTLKETTLGQKEKGSRVNLEVDLLAKYLEQLGVAYGV